jgi:amino acid permease
MASTGFDAGNEKTAIDRHPSTTEEKILSNKDGEPQYATPKDEETTLRYSSVDPNAPKLDLTRRQLKPRHIQLIGIGGTIGTALFVQIGQGLINGGPGSLFMAFTIW